MNIRGESIITSSVLQSLENATEVKVQTLEFENTSNVLLYKFPTTSPASGDVLTDTNGDKQLEWAPGGGGGGVLIDNVTASGTTTYSSNKINTQITALIDDIGTPANNKTFSNSKITTSLSNKADLVSGKVPSSQLPTSVMELKGSWNASTNTPDLTLLTNDIGDTYLVSVGGTRTIFNLTSFVFVAGDYVLFTGATNIDVINQVNITVGDLTGHVQSNGANLGINQIVETDGTKKFISVAKNNAYNKSYGTSADTVAEGSSIAGKANLAGANTLTGINTFNGANGIKLDYLNIPTAPAKALLTLDNSKYVSGAFTLDDSITGVSNIWTSNKVNTMITGGSSIVTPTVSNFNTKIFNTVLTAVTAISSGNSPSDFVVSGDKMFMSCVNNNTPPANHALIMHDLTLNKTLSSYTRASTNQFSGMYSCTISGNTLAVTSSNAVPNDLLMFDISGGFLNLLSSISMSPGGLSRPCFYKQFILIVNNSILQIRNNDGISYPIIATLTVGSAFDLIVINKILYMTGGGTAIKRVNLTDPLVPVVLTNFTAIQTVSRFYPISSTLCAMYQWYDSSTALHIYDFSSAFRQNAVTTDPIKLSSTSNITTGRNIASVVFTGTHWIITDANSNPSLIYVFNHTLTTNAVMTQIASSPFTYINEAGEDTRRQLGAGIVGNRLYFTNLDNGYGNPKFTSYSWYQTDNETMNRNINQISSNLIYNKSDILNSGNYISQGYLSCDAILGKSAIIDGNLSCDSFNSDSIANKAGGVRTTLNEGVLQIINTTGGGEYKIVNTALNPLITVNNTDISLNRLTRLNNLYPYVGQSLQLNNESSSSNLKFLSDGNTTFKINTVDSREFKVLDSSSNDMFKVSNTSITCTTRPLSVNTVKPQTASNLTIQNEPNNTNMTFFNDGSLDFKILDTKYCSFKNTSGTTLMRIGDTDLTVFSQLLIYITKGVPGESYICGNNGLTAKIEITNLGDIINIIPSSKFYKIQTSTGDLISRSYRNGGLGYYEIDVIMPKLAGELKLQNFGENIKMEFKTNDLITTHGVNTLTFSGTDYILSSGVTLKTNTIKPTFTGTISIINASGLSNLVFDANNEIRMKIATGSSKAMKFQNTSDVDIVLIDVDGVRSANYKPLVGGSSRYSSNNGNQYVDVSDTNLTLNATGSINATTSNNFLITHIGGDTMTFNAGQLILSSGVTLKTNTIKPLTGANITLTNNALNGNIIIEDGGNIKSKIATADSKTFKFQDSLGVDLVSIGANGLTSSAIIAPTGSITKIQNSNNNQYVSVSDTNVSINATSNDVTIYANNNIILTNNTGDNVSLSSGTFSLGTAVIRGPTLKAPVNGSITVQNSSNSSNLVIADNGDLTCKINTTDSKSFKFKNSGGSDIMTIDTAGALLAVLQTNTIQSYGGSPLILKYGNANQATYTIHPNGSHTMQYLTNTAIFFRNNVETTFGITDVGIDCTTRPLLTNTVKNQQTGDLKITNYIDNSNIVINNVGDIKFKLNTTDSKLLKVQDSSAIDILTVASTGLKVAKVTGLTSNLRLENSNALQYIECNGSNVIINASSSSISMTAVDNIVQNIGADNVSLTAGQFALSTAVVLKTANIKPLPGGNLYVSNTDNTTSVFYSSLGTITQVNTGDYKINSVIQDTTISAYFSYSFKCLYNIVANSRTLVSTGLSGVQQLLVNYVVPAIPLITAFNMGTVWNNSLGTLTIATTGTYMIKYHFNIEPSNNDGLITYMSKNNTTIEESVNYSYGDSKNKIFEKHFIIDLLTTQVLRFHIETKTASAGLSEASFMIQKLVKNTL